MDSLSLSAPSVFDYYTNSPRGKYHILENELAMSPFHLDNSCPDINEMLRQLCERAKEAPSYGEYKSQHGIIKLYAITENSGGISIAFSPNAEPEIFEHKGSGTTVLGWSEEDFCIREIEESYHWTAEEFRWLITEPIQVKGKIKAVETL